jgi:hypothetical protein
MLELKNVDFNILNSRHQTVAVPCRISNISSLTDYFFDAHFRYQVSDDPAKPVTSLSSASMLETTLAVRRQAQFVGLSRLYDDDVGIAV